MSFETYIRTADLGPDEPDADGRYSPGQLIRDLRVDLRPRIIITRADLHRHLQDASARTRDPFPTEQYVDAANILWDAFEAERGGRWA